MQTGYYSAAAGMVTQFNRLNTISNNLANVNTVGFKEDNLIVGDFMRIYKEARDDLSLDNNTKESAQFLNRTMAKAPQIVESFTDHSVGHMQKTNNPLDFALSREGLFFAVKTPQGIRLTRDGSFTKDEEGTLVNKQGYEVLPADYFQTKEFIKINDKASIIETDKNGQMYTNLPSSVKMSQGFKLFVANPDSLAKLQKEGDNLYVYDGIERSVSLKDSGAVLQNFVEKSNVNAVKEMTSLIETNRLVGMYQKVMDTQMNDMNRDAITKIAAKV